MNLIKKILFWGILIIIPNALFPMGNTPPSLPLTRVNVQPQAKESAELPITPPAQTSATQRPPALGAENPQERRTNPAVFLPAIVIPMTMTIYFLTLHSNQSNDPFPSPDPKPKPTPQCSQSTQACLDTNITTDVRTMCWDAQITMNANTTNSTTVQRSCLCPVDGINNSTEITSWALANLLATNSSQTLGNTSLCIRPNLKPCATTNGCSDARQAFLQLKDTMRNTTSHAPKRTPRTMKHRLQQPRQRGNKRGK